MKTFFSIFLTFLFTFSQGLIFSQTFPGDNPLPKDSAVITGKLNNGLTYYIRQNHKPKNRVSFRLVVNAGSVLEDNDQQGLAHFLEHMCFNGTQDFNKHALIDFLEESGVNFGADLNAYTSFDQTVYMFQIPSDRKGLLDTAFMILENWAGKVSLEGEEIDNERGVIREEWRLGLGAQDRMRKKTFPIILKGSRYAVRLPIGKMNVIDSCKYETLRRFYHDWYRPDLMAVIVVGDIDPAYAERQIKTHFSKLKNPKQEKERINYNIPNNGQPLVAVATDKEATSTTVAMFRKMPKFNIKTNDNYRTKIKFDLFVSLMNARFFEQTQKPDAPFLYAGSSYGSFLARSLDAFTVYAMVKENKVDDAVYSLVQSFKQIKRYGFTEDELKRQKVALMSNLEKALQEKNKTDSRNFVNKYIANFLEGDPYPGIDYEVALTKSVLPGITLDEVNQIAYYFAKNNGLVVLVTGPDKKSVTIPDEQEIMTTLTKAREAEVAEYKEETIKESLIEGPLAKAGVINATTNKEFGTTELRLSNGVNVILKPTDFKNDEILMTAMEPGGTSVVPDKDFVSAFFASQIINMSGVGAFDNVSLKKFMTGKNANVTPQIGKLTQGLQGKSVKKDLETMLQLTYLYFTQPRKDTTAFKTFKSQMLTQFQFMRSNPRAVFYDTLYKLATQNDTRTLIIPTVKQINSISLDKAYNFYKNSFADANGFTFVFVGSFNTDSMTALVTKYLGALPSAGGEHHWKDVSPEFPAGITSAVVHKGTEPQSMVNIMMDGPFDWNTGNLIKMHMVMKILGIQLRESMREEQGGVYGVSARENISKYPKQEINISIGWGCAPKNVDTLVQTVFYEINHLQKNGPSDVNLVKAKETTIRDYETHFQENKYWLNKLKNSVYWGVPMLNLDQIKTMVSNVTAADIEKLANTYFTPGHYLKVVLKPEE